MHSVRMRMRTGRRLQLVAVLTITAVVSASALVGGEGRTAATGPGLRLALLHAVAGDTERHVSPSAPAGRSSLQAFARGYSVRATAAKSQSTPSFGQPTIAGVGGWGFEADLRVDPSNTSRIYISSPDSGGSDTSWIWRSLDGGRTFKWIPAAAPLNGKVTACPGGGDTELAVDGSGRLYFNDLSLANFSVSRSDDQGRTFLPCNSTAVPDGGVDRQWYALDGDPTAGGSLYLTNDEVGSGNVQCGTTQVNNVLVIYRSPAAGALGATAGLQFGLPYHITQPGSCDEGIMGNDEVSPVATTTGQLVNGRAAKLAAAVRHVYVIHDDGSLSKILIARCFPVAFGPAIANVSDPSGLNCVDLPVANLGAGVRTGGNFPSLAIDNAGNLYAVWEQARLTGALAGDTSLLYAYSTDEGASWSKRVQVPTGLANNVFAWAAAGDDGRVDIAWYGTAGHVDPAGGPQQCPGGNGGPDTVAGPWSLYLTQTLNGHARTVSFTPPVLASEHPVRRGGIQTIIGNQCGGATNLGLSGTTRTLGDFLQLRIGPNGEAEISYGDSDNVDGNLMGSHAMFVTQTGGTGVYARKQPSGGQTALGSTTDPAGDATYDALGAASASMPNLDILSSSISRPAVAACHPAGTACLRVSMQLGNLSLAAPAGPDTDTDLVWLTQWLVPASASCSPTAPSCASGGLNFDVYAESYQGGAVQCWTGQNAVEQNADGLQLTYPGATQLTAPGACAFTTGPGGTVTIDVPQSAVSLDAGVAPFSSRLYSVTAGTMTLPAQANSVPSLAGIGGVAFNLIDVAPAYDASP
ncbi:MAG: hypothetical protein ACXVQ3_03385 [Gaiellaceae bacterium]